MSVLTQASSQWYSRPSDERFINLNDLLEFKKDVKHRSGQRLIKSSNPIKLVPVMRNQSDAKPGIPLESQHDDMVVRSKGGDGDMDVKMTHHSFNQISTLASAPANYLRSLPPAIAAKALNYGLAQRDKDMSALLTVMPLEEDITLRAVNGPTYGRIWDADVAKVLVDRFGDGRTGDWRVPGEFGQEVEITKENTTLYAGDRDMFVFLADERNRIEIPNRRAGSPGSLARGFFVWNSEVGAATIGCMAFMFDFVCANRIVWGAENVKTIKVRHTAGAPDRWLDEVTPQLEEYAESSEKPIKDRIASAMNKPIRGEVLPFLSKQFGNPKTAMKIMEAHEEDESRPIETLWDATVGATAFARTIIHQDARVKMEKAAGDLLELAA